MITRVIISTFILSFLITTILFSQRSKNQIDSILNVYERRYRVPLNESDFQLISKQVGEIGTDCSKLERILLSANLNNNYKIEILNEFKEWKKCSNIILDFIDIYKIKEDSDFSDVLESGNEINYPIYQKINNDEEYLKHFTEYLTESDYLDNCGFLLRMASIQKLKFLSALVKKGGKHLPINDSCKKANLILLNGVSSDLNSLYSRAKCINERK